MQLHDEEAVVPTVVGVACFEKKIIGDMVATLLPDLCSYCPYSITNLLLSIFSCFSRDLSKIML